MIVERDLAGGYGIGDRRQPGGRAGPCRHRRRRCAVVDAGGGGLQSPVRVEHSRCTRPLRAASVHRWRQRSGSSPRPWAVSIPIRSRCRCGGRRSRRRAPRRVRPHRFDIGATSAAAGRHRPARRQDGRARRQPRHGHHDPAAGTVRPQLQLGGPAPDKAVDLDPPRLPGGERHRRAVGRRVRARRRPLVEHRDHVAGAVIEARRGSRRRRARRAAMILTSARTRSRPT